MNSVTALALTDPIGRLLGEWSMGLNTYSIILRIAVAVLFASVIGCERSSKRHSAGLRTFVLISFASTVSMILDIYLATNYLIERIQAIQKDLPKHDNPFYEEEQAFSEAADEQEQYLLAGMSMDKSRKNRRRRR